MKVAFLQGAAAALVTGAGAMHVERQMRETVRAAFAVPGLINNEGLVMDAGANNGQDTEFFAQLLPTRTVLAVEPLRKHCAKIRAMTSKFAKIEVVRGALGNVTGTDSYPASLESHFDQISLANHANTTKNIWASDHQSGQVAGSPATAKRKPRRRFDGRVWFDVMTVDALCANRTLAFAHWDVEGLESQVLDGAQQTIASDRPLFTVESFPRSEPATYLILMRKVVKLDYHAYEIDEQCGKPSDCRNYLCVPKEKTGLLASDAVLRAMKRVA